MTPIDKQHASGKMAMRFATEIPLTEPYIYEISGWGEWVGGRVEGNRRRGTVYLIINAMKGHVNVDEPVGP